MKSAPVSRAFIWQTNWMSLFRHLIGFLTVLKGTRYAFGKSPYYLAVLSPISNCSSEKQGLCLVAGYVWDLLPPLHPFYAPLMCGGPLFGVRVQRRALLKPHAYEGRTVAATEPRSVAP